LDQEVRFRIGPWPVLELFLLLGSNCGAQGVASEPKQERGESSDLKRNGSAGRDKTRTFFELNATLAIPWSRWGAEPYITFPLAFAVPGSVMPTTRAEHFGDDNSDVEHPFLIALRWAKELGESPGLKRTEIARKTGVSRARVTQIMNLLRLPNYIQEFLSSPPAPLTLASFSERSLRRVLAIADEAEQACVWEELLHEITASQRKK
jgi:hypothetical protein